MDGNISWPTIAISWILSSATTIAILYVALRIKRRCCKGHKEKSYQPTPGLVDQKDLSEWLSEKPLKTSSPRATRLTMQDDKCPVKKDKTLPKPDHSSYTTEKNPSHQCDPNHPKGMEPINQKNISQKDENILRKSDNKMLMAPSPMFSHPIYRNPMHTEPCLVSISSHNMNQNKDQRQTTLIRNLEASPTEKRRQSYNRIKTRRESSHTISVGNITEAANADKKNRISAIVQRNSTSAGNIDSGHASSKLPPRPLKPTTSTLSIKKEILSGQFEIKPSSNSPPPILLPLTASSICRKNNHASQNSKSISKSLSSDTFPLRSIPLNQSNKVTDISPSPQNLCNSSC